MHARSRQVVLEIGRIAFVARGGVGRDDGVRHLDAITYDDRSTSRYKYSRPISEEFDALYLIMSCQLVDVAESLGNYPTVEENVTLTSKRNIDGSKLEDEETVVRTTTTTFTERKIAPWAFPGYAEDALVDAIAYCPTDDQVHTIIEHGNAVVAAGEMLVKGSTKKIDVEPTQTVWFNEKHLFGSAAFRSVQAQMTRYDDEDFVMAFDRDAPMTFGTPSMGMNGLLKNFAEANAKRVNLFMGDEDAVFDLLQKFLAFRCKFQDTIVEQTITAMTEKSPNSALLDLALVVKNATAGGATFASLGIGLRSFCQTWDPVSGVPNFSQHSPHFQTKVVVRDPARLFAAIRRHKGTQEEGAACVMFQEYGKRVIDLKKAFIAKEYEKQFVDLDALYARMAMQREFDGVVPFVLNFLTLP